MAKIIENEENVSEDLNGDGIINKDDVSLLQKHLVGWISKE